MVEARLLVRQFLSCKLDCALSPAQTPDRSLCQAVFLLVPHRKPLNRSIFCSSSVANGACVGARGSHQVATSVLPSPRLVAGLVSVAAHEAVADTREDCMAPSNQKPNFEKPAAKPTRGKSRAHRAKVAAPRPKPKAAAQTASSPKRNG